MYILHYAPSPTRIQSLTHSCMYSYARVDEVSASSATGSLVVVVAVLGVVVAVACFLFLYRYRTKPVIKFAQVYIICVRLFVWAHALTPMWLITTHPTPYLLPLLFTG